MGRVCNRCGNVVADNMMFCNKCGNHLGDGENRENYKNVNTQTKDSQTNMIRKYQKQIIIVVVALLAILLLAAIAVVGSPKVIGAWKMTAGYSIYTKTFTVHINKNTIVFNAGGDTKTYPIKIKNDEIIIDLSMDGDGEQIWKYQIQGDSIIIESQRYNSDGELETETLSGVRIE